MHSHCKVCRYILVILKAAPNKLAMMRENWNKINRALVLKFINEKNNNIPLPRSEFICEKVRPFDAVSIHITAVQ